MQLAMVGPITASGLDFVSGFEEDLPESHRFGMNTDLVNALVRQGHRIHVVTGAADSRKKVWSRSFGCHRLTMVPTRARVAALGLYLRQIRDLHRALTAHGPYDLIHAHWLYDYSLAALLTRERVLLTVHDWPAKVMRNDPCLRTRARFALSKLTLAAARRRKATITAPSAYMRDVAEGELRLAKVRIVPNGFPAALFCERGQTPSRPILLAINIGFSAMKNITSLLEAFVQVRAAVPEAELRLVGAGYEHFGAAWRHANANGQAGGVSFLGTLPRDTILSELRRASLFVHPSLEESFGMVVIEAMSQGVPVLGGDQSGAVPWLLDGGNAGYLSNVANPDVLAQDILAAISDPAALQRVADAGQARAKQEFTAEAMVDRYLTLYGEVAGKPSNPA